MLLRALPSLVVAVLYSTGSMPVILVVLCVDVVACSPQSGC